MIVKPSIHQQVHQLFLNSPNELLTTAKIQSFLEKQKNIKVKKEILTMILTRLYRKDRILRSPTQLSRGYIYSLKNEKKLTNTYQNYLLPYSFNNKVVLIP